jgi:hypothetical protein
MAKDKEKEQTDTTPVIGDRVTPKTPGKVRVRALETVTVNGKKFEKDQEGDVTPHEHAALARYFVKVVTCLLLLLGLAFGVQAQTYSPYFVNNALTGTNLASLNGVSSTNTYCAPTTTNSYLWKINLTRYDRAWFQFGFTPTGAGVTNVVLNFDASGNGTNWVTNYWSWTVSGAGYTTSQQAGFGTNLTVDSIGWLRLNTIANTNSGGITNYYLLAAPKPIRSGS